MSTSTSTTTRSAPATAHLSDADFAHIGVELDTIRDEVMNDLGEDDARYIHRLIAVQRGLETGGRALLLISLVPPAWAAGTAALSVAKILENMEIGHNVLHGQWDWMGDPEIHSTTWEWDSASSAQGWKYSHNYIHHTYTNVLGKDRDLGYAAMRVHAVIFCGHFPDGAHSFTEDQLEDETRGHFYVRQPHGHLPYLRRHAQRRKRARLTHRNRTSWRPTRRSRHASPWLPATACWTLDPIAEQRLVRHPGSCCSIGRPQRAAARLRE